MTELELLPRAIALHQAGDLVQSEQLYVQLLQSHPDHPIVLHLLGVIALQSSQNELAIQRIGRAIELAPDQPQFYSNLGLAYVGKGLLADAIDTYQRGLQIQPEMAEMQFNLGIAYQTVGTHADAVKAFRKALQLDSKRIEYALALVHELQQLCEWNGLENLAQRIIDAVEASEIDETETALSPFAFLALPIPTSAAQQLKVARHWTRGRHPTSHRPFVHRANEVARRTRAKIKIGYLSADFRDHPVSLLTAELFEAHDRNRFEIFGYSIGKSDASAIGTRIKKSFDHYRDIEDATYTDAAQIIHQDQIDILVDLQGHTQQARIEILALRPAPIQVTYLGYPSTMGAEFIDTILVDDYIVPTEQQPYFDERLIHLPTCFMVNDRHREIDSRIPTRREVGLPDDAFVFCGFSAYYKITPAVFRVWMRLLDAIPDSVLWLRQGGPIAMANLEREAIAEGVSADRLIFAPFISMPQHLARQRLADLFLDTFPYNQHSTACDALRMGLPVITRVGATFASRVSGSLLRTLQLPELTTTSFEEYASMAIKLANDRSQLETLRRKLGHEVESSSLFDGRAFARNIELLYQRMWQDFLDEAPSKSNSWI